MGADHGQQQANEAERYAMEHMTVYQCISKVQRKEAKQTKTTSRLADLGNS